MSCGWRGFTCRLWGEFPFLRFFTHLMIMNERFWAMSLGPIRSNTCINSHDNVFKEEIEIRVFECLLDSSSVDRIGVPDAQCR